MDQQFSNTKKDKCCKSSKIKPMIKESQDLNTVSEIQGNMNLKIKKSGKTGPMLQKKVNTGMETLEDLLKNKNSNSMESEKVNQFHQNNEQNFDNDEDQLKQLLEKSIFQKRILDNHTADKQTQIQGSFEAQDVAASITEGKIYKEIDDKYLIKCVVEWKQRPNGIQPTKSCYDNIELRKHCSQLLLDFYESKIISKEEIDKLQKQSEIKSKEVKNITETKQKYEFEEPVAVSNEGIQKKKIIEQISQNEIRGLQNEKNQETQLERQKKQLMEIMNQQDQSKEKQSSQTLEQIMGLIKVQSESQKNISKKKEEVSETDIQKQKLLELMNRQETNNMNNNSPQINQIEILSSANSRPLTDTNESDKFEQNEIINKPDSQINSEKIHCQMDLES